MKKISCYVLMFHFLCTFSAGIAFSQESQRLKKWTVEYHLEMMTEQEQELIPYHDLVLLARQRAERAINAHVKEKARNNFSTIKRIARRSQFHPPWDIPEASWTEPFEGDVFLNAVKQISRAGINDEIFLKWVTESGYLASELCAEARKKEIKKWRRAQLKIIEERRRFSPSDPKPRDDCLYCDLNMLTNLVQIGTDTSEEKEHSGNRSTGSLNNKKISKKITDDIDAEEAIFPTAPKGVINNKTGEFYPAVPGGVINSKTGEFYPAVP